MQRSAIWIRDISRISWGLIPVLALATIFCCTAGLVCSIFMAPTARATVAGYVVTSTLFFVPVLLAWAGSRALSENVTAWIAMPSPMFVAMNLVDLDPAKVTSVHLWLAHLIFDGVIVLAFLFAARARLGVLLREG